MQSRTTVERWNGLAVAGALLLFVGVGWLVMRELRFDPFAGIAEAGWPYFVILPGVALLVLSLIPIPPRGLGFAIAGAVVTTTGAALLYQDATAHWESWAYAWILVGPGAAGLGMLVYGLIFDLRDLVGLGARLVTIAIVSFAAGYWFFETIFATGRTPIDLGIWWPVVIIAVGLAVLVVSLITRGQRSRERVDSDVASVDEPGGLR